MSDSVTAAPAGRRRFLHNEWLQFAGVLLLLAVTRTSLANHYQVPSGSMQPTLEPGDRVVVDMRAYGLRVPFTDIELVDNGDPRPGDVVVFKSPADGERLIKRVVATGGQTVSLLDGHLQVDGQPLAAALDLTIVTLQPVTETYDLAPGLHLLANSLLYPKFETDPLAGGDLTAWRWDPVSLRYVQLTDSTALVPGEAFFVRVRTATHAVAHGFAALPVGAGGVQPTVALATQGAASIPAQSSASRQATGVQVPTGPPVVTWSSGAPAGSNEAESVP